MKYLHKLDGLNQMFWVMHAICACMTTCKVFNESVVFGGDLEKSFGSLQSERRGDSKLLSFKALIKN